jgi:hypothetical protein
MSWLYREYGQVDLGDARRNRRVVTSAQRISAEPSAGFTQSFENPSELEGYYRLMNNENVTADGLLAPHHSSSWQRAADEDRDSVLVVHDTSEFVYKGDVPRKRLKPKADASSFYGHFALAVSETQQPVVHGVVAQGVYRVVNKKWVEGQSEEDEVSLSIGSQRWVDIATRASAAAPESLDLIHVMDREGDSYKLMAHLVALGDSFVIRAQHNRSLETAAGRLFDSIPSSAFELERDVPLSRRGRKRLPDARKRNPVRKSRVAKVIIRATTIEVKRSSGLAETIQPSMWLSFVEVIEKDPPEGEKAVHWRILSTLPVDTQEQTTRVVDIYRKRWLIEEFFKALKTGCSAEKRQGRSLFTLWNTIAMLVPIAWRILGLRVVSRSLKPAPYETVVDDIELLALREMVPKRMLGRKPTAIDVTLAIARLGGHLKHNGPPGWLTLGRGAEKLDTASRAWKAALKLTGQSMEFEL